MNRNEKWRGKSVTKKTSWRVEKEKQLSQLNAINLHTNQEREKEKRLLMMKAMFKKLFKGSSKDRVAAVNGPAPANIGSNDPEANKVGSPSKRIKWWESSVVANFTLSRICVSGGMCF